MSKSKRNRTRRPARGKLTKDPKPKILVVTEGEVTEPEYIRGFTRIYRNLLVEIVIESKAGSAPKTLVEAAKKLKKEAEKQADRKEDDFLKYDEVWCVFDVDEHPNIPSAKEMARDNNIKLAISNPCFEIWLWLHFAEQPGVQHRHELQKKMKQHIPSYSSKNKHVNYSDYKDGYETAVSRAKKLEEEVNPSTSVWKLTEQIRKNA